MASTGRAVLPSPLFDRSGIKRMSPMSPLIIPGLLAYWEPGTMADRTLVPANGSRIENQSGWGVDLLGESARYLDVTNTITTGVVSRPASGACDVLHGRGVATGPEIFSLGNQRIRDHIDGNRSRRWGWLLSYEVLNKAADTYTPTASQRIMGLVDSSSYKTGLALSADRSLITGYPTGATRVFNQPGSATGGRNLAIAVHDGYTGAASASTTLLSLHNGGAGAPAPSLRIFWAAAVDMQVAGITTTVLQALGQARHNENLATGGIYA